MKYKSKITFEYSGNTANAKSVLSVLGACIKSGDEITLICDGEDEQEHFEPVAYVESGSRIKFLWVQPENYMLEESFNER